MKGIIDTSSLLNVAKYYLPFDKNGKLKRQLELLFNSGEILVIDKVELQSRNIAKGVVAHELPFIFNQRKRIINTSAVLPDARFFTRLETDYCNQFIRIRKKLTDAEFDNQKSEFLKDADAKMILYALKIAGSKPTIVTEESSNQNDGKLFKKIPTICSLEGIDCCTVPEFFKQHCHLDLGALLS